MNSFKTIKAPSEGIYKAKGSKFIAFAIPINSEIQFKEGLSRIKKKYHDAGHHCYGFSIGPEGKLFRYSDDGEPNNSAGKPIYGQLLSFGLTNISIIVIRYFGGTKLGVGGLAQAYKYSAQITLEASEIISKTIDVVYEIKFDYDLMNKVMRIIKDHDLKIVLQKLDLKCEYHIAVRKKSAQQVFENFEKLYKLTITKLE